MVLCVISIISVRSSYLLTKYKMMDAINCLFHVKIMCNLMCKIAHLAALTPGGKRDNEWVSRGANITL